MCVICLVHIMLYVAEGYIRHVFVGLQRFIYMMLLKGSFHGIVLRYAHGFWIFLHGIRKKILLVKVGYRSFDSPNTMFISILHYQWQISLWSNQDLAHGTGTTSIDKLKWIFLAEKIRSRFNLFRKICQPVLNIADRAC